MKHPGMINKVYNISDEIFNWSEDSFKKASEIIKKYPDSRQQSAVIPLPVSYTHLTLPTTPYV